MSCLKKLNNLRLRLHHQNLRTPEIHPVFVNIITTVLAVLPTPLIPPTPATAAATVPIATLQSILGFKIWF